MKKTMTPDELRQHALRTGATVTIDGKLFNAGGVKLAPPTAAAPAPKPPALATTADTAPALAAPTFTRAEVEAMLAQAEARFQAQLAGVLNTLKTANQARQEGAVAVGFTPTYDKNGAISFVGVEYQRLQ